MLTHCPPQQPAEPMPEYAHRVLGYALAYGIEPLSLSQLETADSAAQQAVTALPATFQPHDAVLDATLHALRLRLAARMAEKRRQLAALQRALDELDSPSHADGIAPPEAADTVESEESDADRATKLLRAALLLIMGQPPNSNGGGRPAPLIPPSPTRPPAGSYADSQPTLTDHRRNDDIAF